MSVFVLHIEKKKKDEIQHENLRNEHVYEGEQHEKRYILMRIVDDRICNEYKTQLFFYPLLKNHFY